MSVDIDLKEQTWAGVNKMSVPLEGGGRQVFSLGGGTPTLQTKTVTYTPTTSQQTDTISPDSGYDGLSLVNVIVNAMQGGADVPTFTLSGVQDGATVTCDKTYAEVRALYDDGLLVALANAPTYNCVYAMSICDEPGSSSLRYAVLDANGYPMGDVLITSSAMTYSVPSVTQKTMNLPTATKGTVTNHTMTIGVGVTNSRGFYASGVTRGNPIYVSASELVSGSQTVSGNGTYDVTDLAELIVNVQGGASNFITGTFTTGSTAGHTEITLPYTGSGYPIMCVVVVDGGAYHSGTTWYTSTQRYAIGQWTMTKSNMSTTPSYTTSGAQNQGVTTWVYKNTSSTSYSRSSAMSTNVYSSSNASNSGANTIKLKSGNVLSYYVNTSSYGLHPNITYRYFIVYS